VMLLNRTHYGNALLRVPERCEFFLCHRCSDPLLFDRLFASLHRLQFKTQNVANL